MRASITTVLMTALFIACGGSGASTTGPTDGDERSLDFSSIAGQWSGWGVESLSDGSTRESWVSIDVEETANPGEVVGTFRVGYESPDGEPECILNLVAEAAEPPAYRVEITGAGCTSATMDIEHDATASVLFTDVVASGEAFTASHVLEPGSDPGAQPE